MIHLRHLLQAVCLAVFAALLGQAFFTGHAWQEPNPLLQLDPLAAVLGPLAARAWSWLFAPGLLVLATAPLLGRAFCGWVCPLGTTMDMLHSLPRRRTLPCWLLAGRWLLLAGFLAAAAFGISLAHMAAPLSLAGRMYGLLALPALGGLLSWLQQVGRPVLDALGLTGLALAELKIPLYATIVWTGLMTVLLLGGSALVRRWWCRALCPVGALLGLCGRKPAWKRQVFASCTHCGRCARQCPMGAITGRGSSTSHLDCIQCRRCQAVCPEQAVMFGLANTESARPQPAPANPARRAILAGAGLGLAAGILPAPAISAPALRPPGSLPEDPFLARCTRCGACVSACPTKVLQPAWFQAGLNGLFSPRLSPVRGYCDPQCTACGRACPTGAIRALLPDQRVWAKTGTAQVHKKLCLAWNDGKKCLVCDEVCPYGAVHLQPQPNLPVWAPVVNELACAGCGYCEHHCPVAAPKAITVLPENVIRLEHGGLQAAARAKGLTLDLKPKPGDAGYDAYGSHGGFGEGGDGSGQPGGGLPPGFSE